MARIMTDTNILISGMAFAGTERHLLQVICSENHTLVLSEYILRETRDVLRRKFPGKEFMLDVLLETVQVELNPLPSAEKVKEAREVIRDPKDAPILATVIEARPDLFVSGDLDFHTPKVARLIKARTAKEALAMMSEIDLSQ